MMPPSTMAPNVAVGRTAGVMNAVWMAALGLVMTLEKMTSTPRFSRMLGMIFVLIGVAMMAADVAGIGWLRFVTASA